MRQTPVGGCIELLTPADAETKTEQLGTVAGLG
jgi:hypothetical protein